MPYRMPHVSEINETATEAKACREPRPPKRSGVLVSPVQATAEDTRFELVTGCPQHAFQVFVRGFWDVRERPDL